MIRPDSMTAEQLQSLTIEQMESHLVFLEEQLATYRKSRQKAAKAAAAKKSDPVLARFYLETSDPAYSLQEIHSIRFQFNHDLRSARTRFISLFFSIRGLDEWVTLPAYIATAHKMLEREDPGGRKPSQKEAARNKKMAAEFSSRRGKAGKSDTALKAEIGKKYDLSRSQSVDAINSVLKKLSGKVS